MFKIIINQIYEKEITHLQEYLCGSKNIHIYTCFTLVFTGVKYL